MVKTKFENIVDVSSIGVLDNPIKQGDLYDAAANEQLSPATKDTETTLLLAIDVQKDFMERGSLPVPGSHADTERLTKWVYANMEKLTRIVCSLDTHQPYQIFFPYWWIDANGNHPAPFTAITKSDIDSGKWKAVICPVESVEYVTALEAAGKKVLVIWPPHCIEGTIGHSLENQFANMVYFHSIARNTLAKMLVKGQHPATEMYGVFKPEYDPKNAIDINILNHIKAYDKIVIAGQAKSHCVLESIAQMLDYYGSTDVTKKIYILEDCMSCIPSFEAATDQAYAEFKAKYRVNLVTTATFNL